MHEDLLTPVAVLEKRLALVQGRFEGCEARADYHAEQLLQEQDQMRDANAEMAVLVNAIRLLNDAEKVPADGG